MTKILSIQLISKVSLFHLYCKHSQTCMFRVPESFKYLSKIGEFSNLRLYSEEHCYLIKIWDKQALYVATFSFFSNAVKHNKYLQCIGSKVRNTIFAETFFFHFYIYLRSYSLARRKNVYYISVTFIPYLLRFY